LSDIFIVGSPRSGTSWLRTLLASHPDLASPHELHLFDRYLVPIEQAWQKEETALQRRLAAGLSSGAGLVSLLGRDELRGWMSDLVARSRRAALAARPGSSRLLEKTPGNARQLELIRQVVPGARFVHIVRDPRRAIASMLEKSRRPFGEWAPGEVLRGTSLWRAHVSAALRDARPEDTILVHYEALRADIPGTLRQLADFLALPGDVESWLAGDPASPAHERERTLTIGRAIENAKFDDPAAARLRQAIGAPTSRTLSPAALWYIESRCAAEMAMLDYEPRLFTPGRAQPLRALTAAVELRGRRLLHQMSISRDPSARRRAGGG
jgi:hypothetical protein